MKRMRKGLCCLLAMVLMLSLAAGCSPKEKEEEAQKGDDTGQAGTDDGGDQTGEEKGGELAAIDWYVDLPWWTWGGKGFGEDMTSKMIMEKTGVKINFIVPASDGGEQLSTMIASDDLPDIMTLEGWWSNKARVLTYQMANEDYIWSYNDLMEQHAPDMEQYIRKDVFNWHAEADGKTYVLQNFAYSNDDLEQGEQLIPNGCITVRKDLYEAIGSPDMSTPEGFLAACEKVKNEIGTYDGQDIIPIQLYEGATNPASWLAQYFATPYEDADGNYVYDFTQENYKEALSFLNTAYRKGLISEANFSDTRDLVNEKVAGGRVFAMFTAPQDFVAQMQSLYDLDPNAVYVPQLLRNSKGEDPVLQDIRGMGWLNTIVSKKTEYPEKVANLIKYLISDEGLIDMAYGREGVTYEYTADGKIDMTKEYYDAVAADDVKKYGLCAMNLLDNYAFRRKFDIDSKDPKILATADTYIKKPMQQYSYDYSASSLKLDPLDTRKDAMNELGLRISNYRTAVTAELITAKDEAAFEAKYQEAVAELNSMGLADLIAYNNDGFQAAKKALGIDRSWPPFVK